MRFPGPAVTEATWHGLWATWHRLRNRMRVAATWPIKNEKVMRCVGYEADTIVLIGREWREAGAGRVRMMREQRRVGTLYCRYT